MLKLINGNYAHSLVQQQILKYGEQEHLNIVQHKKISDLPKFCRNFVYFLLAS